jgi:hypothetical protein
MSKKNGLRFVAAGVLFLVTSICLQATAGSLKVNEAIYASLNVTAKKGKSGGLSYFLKSVGGLICTSYENGSFHCGQDDHADASAIFDAMAGPSVHHE